MNIMYANIMEDRAPEFEKSGILLALHIETGILMAEETRLCKAQ
jgi:hypothetical protein